MNRPIRLAINGASGRMGRALLELLAGDARFELMHAVVAPGSAHDGEPVSAGAAGALRYAQDWSGAPALDVVIDFSEPTALVAALDHCQTHGIALVSGTTGIDAALESQLGDAGRRIAILRAANFSLGVAMLTRPASERSRSSQVCSNTPP